MTAIHAATLGSNPFRTNARNSPHRYKFLATYNTPAQNWDTLVLPLIVGVNANDSIKMSVYKGSIPDDYDTEEDNDDTDARLDASDFISSKTLTFTEVAPSEGLSNVQFDFDTVFNASNCGATYTVLMEQFDSGGNDVRASIVLCTDRTGVYNYTQSVDLGMESAATSGLDGFGHTTGGAGNYYRMKLTTGTIYTTLTQAHTTTVNGVSTRDPCPAWGIYSREVASPPATGFSSLKNALVNATKNALS